MFLLKSCDGNNQQRSGCLFFLGAGKFWLQWLRVTRGTKRHQELLFICALFFSFPALTPTDTRSVRLYILIETQNQLLLISNYTPQ